MKQRNPRKASTNMQAENVERATWFARLALGDWETTPVPAPAKSRDTTFHVMP